MLTGALRHVLGWGLLLAHVAVVPPLAAESVEVAVPVTLPWTQTSVSLAVGQRVRIEAGGTAQVVQPTAWEWLFGFDFARRVGPEGTYLWPRDYARRGGRRAGVAAFPLAAGREGPYPAFCLIGRIGQEGEPFYVGRRYEAVAERAGPLWLGINDVDLRDNRGAFQARVLIGVEPGHKSPAAARDGIERSGNAGPIPEARVLLLFVDGLRPDVVHEMAAWGLLPNIKRIFLDGGLEVERAFTTFPSNTLVATGALLTGLCPDRTGIKSQNQFERAALAASGPLSEWIPDWLLARTTRPHRVYNLLDKFAPENTHQFLRHRGVPTLSSRLGPACRFTILPIAPMSPPPRWPHRALNALENPFAAAARIPWQLDRINAQYVIDELLGDPEARVIVAWFPMVDKVSHTSLRGQFGAARRDVAAFDQWLGRMLIRLRQVGWDRSTYLILVSDHGHLGGERAPSRRCNLAEEFFHRRLGCNARVVGKHWVQPGSDPERFVFVDHQAWGQASVFLPKGSYLSGPWQPNRLADLMRYDLGPNGGVLNLLEALVPFTGVEWEPGLPKPVDLALVKLDAARALVYRSAENQAIIYTSLSDDGTELYRYEPIRRIRQAEDSTVDAEPALPDADPLGYLVDPTVSEAVGSREAVREALARPQTAGEWLRMTARTDYPDAVVAIAKFFRWNPPVDDLAQMRDPDLVVTTSRGWSFRSDGLDGTDHGSPLREAMRISLFLAGPRIRRGILSEPRRIVDVLPTMLDMIGWPYEPTQLDGQAIRGIYE